MKNFCGILLAFIPVLLGGCESAPIKEEKIYISRLHMDTLYSWKVVTTDNQVQVYDSGWHPPAPTAKVIYDVEPGGKSWISVIPVSDWSVDKDKKRIVEVHLPISKKFDILSTFVKIELEQ